jgi:hypothetical protein
MARRVMFFQEPDSKPLGPSSGLSFPRSEIKTCRESADIRQVFLKFILDLALHSHFLMKSDVGASRQRAIRHVDGR